MSIEKLDFQKVSKQQVPYTILLNSVIQNIPNAEALAIYVFLYSLPPNWDINREYLMSKFNVGDKKLRSIFSYLNRANLLEYHRNQDEKTGKMLGTTIHLLNGEKFDSSVSFKEITDPAEIAGTVKTDPAISADVGKKPTRRFRGTTKEIVNKKENKKAFINKTKSFLDKKSVDNSKRHSFAESMNQMANEKKHIEEHKARKEMEVGTRMPDELRKLIKGLNAKTN